MIWFPGSVPFIAEREGSRIPIPESMGHAVVGLSLKTNYHLIKKLLIMLLRKGSNHKIKHY